MKPISVNNGPARVPQRDWTFLYVLDGDNDLREAATLDMVELDQAGAPENTNVVAQLYRGDLKWNMRNATKKIGGLFKAETPPAVRPDWRGMKVFEVRHEGTDETTSRVPYEGSKSPSDPISLENFVTWTVLKYPAENYAVVLTGHGNEKGILSDSRGKKMEFADVSRALKAASKKTGEKLDVVLFDSCSTATDEAAEAMDGAADYLVASRGKINGRGWSEKATLDFIKGNPKATPRELAESFLSAEHNIDEPVLYNLKS